MAIEGFFVGLSRVARLDPRAKPHRNGVEHIRDLRYRERTRGREHLVDVWRPVPQRGSLRPRHQGPPWPILFYVHGGGFTILSKDTHWPMALRFARRGFLVFNVSYRLAPRHPFPAAIEDVCEALSWVAKNAAAYGGDLERIVFAGESAGANLVTSLSMALAYERPEPFAKRVFATGIRPRAVIPACGLFQVSDVDRLRRRKPHMSSFVFDRLVEIEEAYLGKGPWPFGLALADPVVFFEKGERPVRPLPAYFLPVGTKDPLLPDTRRLAAALRALGASALERYYPGEPHAFHALVMRRAARECWNDTFRFLDEHVPLAP